MLQFDVLVERTLRPVRLLAVFHLAFVVALDLRGDPANTLLSLLVRAVRSVTQVIYPLFQPLKFVLKLSTVVQQFLELSC